MYNYQLKRKALDPNDPHFLDEKEVRVLHRFLSTTPPAVRLVTDACACQ